MLFHANLPIKSGFTGVDVFFTLSGFVISRSIIDQISRNGKINFGNFLVRRFNRIFPALIIMLAVISIIVLITQNTSEVQRSSLRTSMSSLVALANVYLMSFSGGYFDTPTKLNPFVHTWSLSVEWQIWLILPLLFIAMSKSLNNRAKQCTSIILIVTSLVSLLLMFLLNYQSIDSYYHTIVRYWQFSIGSIAALYGTHAELRYPVFSRIASFIGFVGILCSLCFLSRANYPNWSALIPSISTALLLVFSARNNPRLSSILESKFLIWCGNISYSLYLWHWPMIVLAVKIFPEFPAASLIAAILSFVPAFISFKWVENKFRIPKTAKVLNRSRNYGYFFLATLALSVAISFFKSEFQFQNSNRLRIESAIGHDVYHKSLAENYFDCQPKYLFRQALVWNKFVRCQQSKANGQADLILLGNSHAEHLFPGFAELIPELNVKYLIHGGFPARSWSMEMNAIIQSIVSDSHVKIVIIGVNWGQPDFDLSQIEATVQELEESGKSVYLTDDSPSFPFYPGECVKIVNSSPDPKSCTIPAENALRQQSKVLTKLKNVLNKEQEINFIETFKHFCNAQRCFMYKDKKSLFRDTNHLNIYGSKYLVSKILQYDLSLKEQINDLIESIQ